MRQTKAKRLKDWALTFKAISEGRQPVRPTRKDGSLPTRPVVRVDEAKTEHKVMDECMAWLEARGCLVDRMNVGAGILRRDPINDILGGHNEGYCQYGIKDAGDICGMLPDGRHLEVEVKKGRGGSWSEGQQKRCADVWAHNGVYLLVHGIEELKHYLIGVYL